MKGHMCVKADLNDSAQWCYQMSCIVFLLHTIEIYNQLTDMIKGLKVLLVAPWMKPKEI